MHPIMALYPLCYLHSCHPRQPPGTYESNPHSPPVTPQRRMSMPYLPTSTDYIYTPFCWPCKENPARHRRSTFVNLTRVVKRSQHGGTGGFA